MLAAAQRFPALQAGEIDLLVSNSTYTLARDAGQRVSFTGIYYCDGQGFLMRRSGAKTIKDLHRANICFQSAITTEANLATIFAARRCGSALLPSGRRKQRVLSLPAAARR